MNPLIRGILYALAIMFFIYVVIVGFVFMAIKTL